MNKRLKKNLALVLSVTVGLGLLGGVLYYVGWRSILAQIYALGFIGISAVIGTVLLTMLIWLASWSVILLSYGIKVPLRYIIGARLSGYAVTYTTPSLYSGGEPIRALLITDHTPAPSTRIFATIIVERFLGALSLIFFVIGGGIYALLTSRVEAVAKEGVFIGIAFITFWIIVGLVNFTGNFKWASRLIGLLKRPFPRWERGIGRAVDKVAETEDEIYDAFTRHWKGTFLAFLIQLVATFFVFIRPQVFFYFSSGRTFDFAQFSLLFTFNVMISFFFWITPGGLGTGEAALIGIFRLVGVGKEGAVAFSLAFKIVEFVLVAVGLFYLFHKGISRLLNRAKRRRQQRYALAEDRCAGDRCIEKGKRENN